MVTARVAGYMSSTFPDQNIGLERRFDQYYAMRPPALTAHLLNERLSADPGVEEYLTMAYVAGDLRSGKMRLVQAGHPPPMLLRADGSVTLLGEGGLPIGLVDEVAYDQVAFDLRPGDRLRIERGPFANLEATFHGYKGEERAIVLLDMLHKQHRLNLALKDVRPLAAHA